MRSADEGAQASEDTDEIRHQLSIMPRRWFHQVCYWPGNYSQRPLYILGPVRIEDVNCLTIIGGSWTIFWLGQIWLDSAVDEV